MKYWKYTRMYNKYTFQPCGSQFSRGDRHTRAEWEARWGENMKEVPINQLEEEGDARNRSCDSQVFRECMGVA